MLNQTTLFAFQYNELERSPERRLLGRAIAELNRDERRTDMDAILSRIELVHGRMITADPIEKAIAELGDQEILWNWHSEYRFRIPLMGFYVLSRMESSAW